MAAGQGPLIEFSVKSQQGEFFIRKANPYGDGPVLYISLLLSVLLSVSFSHFVSFRFPKQVALQLKGELYIHQGEPRAKSFVPMRTSIKWNWWGSLRWWAFMATGNLRFWRCSAVSYYLEKACRCIELIRTLVWRVCQLVDHGVPSLFIIFHRSWDHLTTEFTFALVRHLVFCFLCDGRKLTWLLRSTASEGQLLTLKESALVYAEFP